MEFVYGVILLLAAFYLGWNIGANDAANCIGTTVGARVLPYRAAALIMALFVILGGTLQGHHVMQTVGKGIVLAEANRYASVNDVPPPPRHAEWFPDDRLPDRAILVALLSAGLFVTFATLSSLPVSTSQAIVGGVAGTGLGLVGAQSGYFDTELMLRIVGAWVVSPLLAMLLAFVAYSALGLALRRARALLWSDILRLGVIASSAYVSFSLGANDVGNAIGPLINRFPDHRLALAVLAGVAVAAGALSFGERVTRTVGRSITPLDYSGALAAQASAAFGVHLFALSGIPVSTSLAIVGAVVGVGLTKGTATLSARKISVIFAGWVLTPLCAALFAALVFRLVDAITTL